MPSISNAFCRVFVHASILSALVAAVRPDEDNTKDLENIELSVNQRAYLDSPGASQFLDFTDSRAALAEAIRQLAPKHCEEGLKHTPNTWNCSFAERICDVQGVTCSPEGNPLVLDLRSENGCRGRDDWQELPRALCSVISLEELRLRSCKLWGQLPCRFRKLKNLTKIDLSDNQLFGVLSEGYFRPEIQELVLAGNHFTGPIPRQVGMASGLEVLNLQDNMMSGPIPAELGLVKSLQLLNLGGNGFEGTLPPELGNMSRSSDSLIINISHNNLHGSLPDEWAGLYQLHVFLARSNNLASSLPAGGLYPRLRNLDLSCNELSGPVPNSIGGYVSLQSLNLSYNRLSGRIDSHPMMFALAQNLLDLDLCNNTLEGSIRPGFKNFKKLRVLRLGSNYFEGQLPELPGGLRVVDLSSNHFSGPIPDWIGSMSNLHFLALSRNELSGEIPHSLGLRDNVHTIMLQDNNLVGPIPRQLGNMTYLKILHLGNNRLNSSIPWELGNLRDLRALLLGNNRLHGHIPSTIGNLIHLKYLSLHGNLLTGEVPNLTLAAGSTSDPDDFDFVTLYGNRLSGSIPPMVSNASQLKGLIAIGNKFGDKPSWLPKHMGDEFHFVNSRANKNLAADLCIVFILFIVLCFMVILKDHLPSFFGRMAIDHYYGAAERPEIKSNRVTLFALGQMLLIGLALLSVYLYKADFFSHGRARSHRSIAYLNLNSELESSEINASFSILVKMLWVTHAALVVFLTMHLPESGDAGFAYSRLKRLISWVIWLLVTVSFSSLSVLYALTKSLPSDNVYSQDLSAMLSAGRGELIWKGVYLLMPALNAGSVYLLLPCLAAYYSEATGITYSALCTMGQIVCIWLAPAVTVWYMDENCKQGWRWTWSECRGSDSFNLEFSFDMDWLGEKEKALCGHLPQVELLQRQDICEPAFLLQGGCSRQIIEVLMELIITSLAFEMSLCPLAYLVGFMLSDFRDGVPFLKVLGLQLPTLVTEDFIWAQDAWIVTAVAWGPLMPELYLWLLASAIINMCVQRLQIDHFGCKVDEKLGKRGVSRIAVIWSLLQFIVFSIFFCLENDYI